MEPSTTAIKAPTAVCRRHVRLGRTWGPQRIIYTEQERCQSFTCAWLHYILRATLTGAQHIIKYINRNRHINLNIALPTKAKLHAQQGQEQTGIKCAYAGNSDKTIICDECNGLPSIMQQKTNISQKAWWGFGRSHPKTPKNNKTRSQQVAAICSYYKC